MHITDVADADDAKDAADKSADAVQDAADKAADAAQSCCGSGSGRGLLARSRSKQPSNAIAGIAGH